MLSDLPSKRDEVSTAETAEEPEAFFQRLLQEILKKIERLEWHHSFVDFCPWLEMVSLDGYSSDKLQRKLFSKHRLTAPTAMCWVTGESSTAKCVQIIPDFTKNKVMRLLGLHPGFKWDINAIPCNFMLLDGALIGAFEELQISFTPTDRLHTDTLRLKIWDPKCRHTPVGASVVKDDLPQRSDASTSVKNSNVKTIGNFEGMPLKVPPNWHISKRAMAYHTLCCYVYHKHEGGKIPLELNDEHSHSTNQKTVGSDSVHRKYAEIFHSAIREDEDKAYEDDDDDLDDDGPASDCDGVYISAISAADDDKLMARMLSPSNTNTRDREISHHQQVQTGCCMVM